MLSWKKLDRYELHIQNSRCLSLLRFDGTNKNVPIVSGATSYTDENGVTYILILHKALFYGERLNHSLLNPNQIRHNGIDFWDNPYDRSNQLSIDVPDTLTIPLHLDGTKVTFESRTPTAEELRDCVHIDLTSETPWNP